MHELHRLPSEDTGMAAIPGGVEIFTVDEVADILRIKRRQVLRLLSSGALKGFRAGKIWRITRESLQEFIEARPTSEPEQQPC